MEILNPIYHDNLSCCLCKKWWIPFMFVCCLTPWKMVVYQTNEFRNCNYLPYYVIFSPCLAFHHGVILLVGGPCDYSVCIMLGSYWSLRSPNSILLNINGVGNGLVDVVDKTHLLFSENALIKSRVQSYVSPHYHDIVHGRLRLHK